MKLSILCIIIAAFTFALADTTEDDSDDSDLRPVFASIQTQLTILSQKTAELEARLDDKQKAEILLYRDRKECPSGYHPMENASGRFIVIGDGTNRGAMSDHTFTDERIINMPCATTIGVAENGFHHVCGTPSTDGSPVSVDLKELVPYVQLLACFRDKGDNPVIA